MGLDHHLEDNGKTNEQVTDNLGKTTRFTVFCLFCLAETFSTGRMKSKGMGRHLL